MIAENLVISEITLLWTCGKESRGISVQAFDTFREFRHSLATFRYVAWALAPLRYIM
jgi:hypothetical protein